MLPASSEPPLITVREQRGSTSAHFVTETIMPQNTEHLSQLIKTPDLLHFIPTKQSVSSAEGEGGIQCKSRALDMQQRAKVQHLKLTSPACSPPCSEADPISAQTTESKHSGFVHLGLSCIPLLKPQMVFYIQILLFTEECKT